MKDRVTWKTVKESRIPNALGLCTTGEGATKLRAFCNEAMERIIDMTPVWGLAVRFRTQATEGQLVWPRQVASILAAAQSLVPMKPRGMFYEFLDFGIGIQDPEPGSGDEGGVNEFIDRNPTCLFSEIRGLDKKVGVYCDVNDDIGEDVLLLGYDENGQWIRTEVAGVWQDGETVSASNTNTYGTLSTNKFSAITGVQKSACNGSIRLYEYDTVNLTQRAIARYDYDETNPLYRVSYIPYLQNSSTASDPVTIDVVARLDFWPVTNDSDYCCVNSIPALKDMMVAVQQAELESLQQNKAAAIASGLALAKASLEGQYRRYGQRVESVMTVPGTAGYGEAVQNLV